MNILKALRRRKSRAVPFRLIRVTPEAMAEMPKNILGIPVYFADRPGGGYDLWPEPEPLRQGEDNEHH